MTASCVVSVVAPAVVLAAQVTRGLTSAEGAVTPPEDLSSHGGAL